MVPSTQIHLSRVGKGAQISHRATTAGDKSVHRFLMHFQQVSNWKHKEARSSCRTNYIMENNTRSKIEYRTYPRNELKSKQLDTPATRKSLILPA